MIIGDPVECKRISDLLIKNHNIYVQPINYPTVPKGTERLRFSPSPLHTEAMMDDVTDALTQYIDVEFEKDIPLTLEVA